MTTAFWVGELQVEDTDKTKEVRVSESGFLGESGVYLMVGHGEVPPLRITENDAVEMIAGIKKAFHRIGKTIEA